MPLCSSLTHEQVRTRSYALLDNARKARKKFNSQATREKMIEECKKRNDYFRGIPMLPPAQLQEMVVNPYTVGHSEVTLVF